MAYLRGGRTLDGMSLLWCPSTRARARRVPNCKLGAGGIGWSLPGEGPGPLCTVGGGARQCLVSDSHWAG